MVFPNGKILQDPSNFEIAIAAGSPVTPDYPSPFRFTGTINKVTLEVR